MPPVPLIVEAEIVALAAVVAALLALALGRGGPAWARGAAAGGLALGALFAALASAGSGGALGVPLYRLCGAGGFCWAGWDVSGLHVLGAGVAAARAALGLARRGARPPARVAAAAVVAWPLLRLGLLSWVS